MQNYGIVWIKTDCLILWPNRNKQTLSMKLRTHLSTKPKADHHSADYKRALSNIGDHAANNYSYNTSRQPLTGTSTTLKSAWCKIHNGATLLILTFKSM